MLKLSTNSKKSRMLIAVTAIVLSLAVAVVAVFSLINCVKLYNSKQKIRNAVICIDPGHGFSDPGASNDNISPYDESSINLAIAQKLRNSLESHGYTAVLLHSGTEIPEGYDANNDGVFDVDERVAYSDSIGAQVYISVHCDSFASNENVNGTRIYYQLNDNISCAALCATIGESIDDARINNRETLLKPMLEDDSFYVIKNRNNLASLLIECGFITNREDAEKLTDPDYQQSFANAVAIGIHSFCN